MSLAAASVLDAIVRGSPFRALRGGPAALALPPWQLAVVRAFDEGVATRVLLADAVGLGKTIQAGLAIAAVDPCGASPHVLVIVPAGLRDQWSSELASRLGLEPWVAEPATWRRERARLPAGASPWQAHPLVVASIDYVKQPDVLTSAMRVAWDLVVLDEAHNAGPGSDRLAAVHALAAASRRSILVTATPHHGDDGQWAALCGVGARGSPDAPVLLVRRTRAEAGVPAARRVRFARLAPSAAEAAMHEWLWAYARLAWTGGDRRVRLAMSVLLKRAASSPSALLRSLEHRRRAIAGPALVPIESQPPLPFDEVPGEHDDGDVALPGVLAAPGLDDRAREDRILEEGSERARLAVRTWTKGEWLLRWLRASAEPAVVFTEYRDTLEAIVASLPATARAAVLHGGLGRAARADALDAFLRGRARVLVATDVAGEGLNLQAAARTAISIELPWTPSRLEQRIGRVDRIGQPRTIRAVCLAGRNSAEQVVASRLTARLRRAHEVLEHGGDGPAADLRVAAVALGVPDDTDVARAARAATPPVMACGPLAPRPALDLASAAWSLARRIASARGARTEFRRPRGPLPWARLRGHRHGNLPRGVVIVFEVLAMTAGGRLAAHTTIAIHVELDPQACRWFSVGSLLRALARLVSPHAARAAVPRLDEMTAWARRRTALERSREALRPADDPPTDPLVQPGLFDRRAIKEAARARAARAGAAERRAVGLEALERDDSILPPSPPEPVAAFLCW